MIRRGCQCVMLSLTSRMQRLCVESWTVGLLYRCWEQLLLVKETLRCGHKRFSAEEMNLRLICVKHLSNSHPNTTALTKIMLDCFVQVCVDRFNRKDSFNFDRSLLIFFPFLYTEIINVRLVNRNSPCSGTVEVLHRGQWGTVCDNGWDLADAAVVCRELDCGEPVDALGDAQVGLGSGPVWMNNAMCTGSESTLKKCGSVIWGFQGVCQSKSAGVICSGKLKTSFCKNKKKYCMFCSERLIHTHCVFQVSG